MTEEELIDQQELFEHYRFKVDPGQSLLRIDKFLSLRLENSLQDTYSDPVPMPEIFLSIIILSNQTIK